MTRIMTLLQLSIACAALAVASGCAVNRATATVDPAADIERIKTAYVVKLPKDERAVNVLIADALRARGVQASTTPAPQGKVDAVVTYADRWMWDITMYMIELTIIVREPGTDFPIATGNAFHTSLTRKSPQEMVDEVLGNIFRKGNP